jgi:hypothetical protein
MNVAEKITSVDVRGLEIPLAFDFPDSYKDRASTGLNHLLKDRELLYRRGCNFCYEPSVSGTSEERRFDFHIFI